MMPCEPYPLLLTPVYKDYIWGGSRIAEHYRRTGTPAVCAESWEVADRPEGMSVVQNGPLAGTALHALVTECGADLVGTKASSPRFPLLIKLIDARAPLSLQVHPDDASASRCGGDAKTECWHVLDADPEACVFAGLRDPTTPDELLEAIRNGEAEALLARLPARPDTTIYIPGGRLHAIGAGCLLLEVQQNSNTTYRVYDWGRVDTDGRPRELHVAQALEVIDFADTGAAFSDPRPFSDGGGNTWYELVTSRYFRLHKVRLTAPEHVLHTRDSFTVVSLVSGAVTITVNGMEIALTPGTSCLVPACVASYDLVPSGSSGVITIRL